MAKHKVEKPHWRTAIRREVWRLRNTWLFFTKPKLVAFAKEKFEYLLMRFRG